MLPAPILDQIIQAIAAGVWNRAEFAFLREPVEELFQRNDFKELTQKAFTTFAENSQNKMPELFNEGYIGMREVQDLLAAYIVRGQTVDKDNLVYHYARRHGLNAPDIKNDLEGYLNQLREAFAAHPIYGPILMARDVREIKKIVEEIKAYVQKPSARDLELKYLKKLRHDYSTWLKTYTPMAGSARLLEKSEEGEIEQQFAPFMNIQFRSFRDNIRGSFGQPLELIQEDFKDVREVLKRVKQLVILGDPGAGKSTTLWRLLVDYAEIAIDDYEAPLPIFLKLQASSPTISVRQQLQNQLKDIELNELMSEGRVALLLDGLNELPVDQKAQKVREIRDLVHDARDNHMFVVVTCRQLDYMGELDLQIDDKVTITPLDPMRVHQFCMNYLPQKGETLFWKLAGDDWQRYWVRFLEDGKFMPGVSEKYLLDIFWNAYQLPQDIKWGHQNGDWERWWHSRTGSRNERNMLLLAQNPYLLFMIILVYADTGDLPPNRGKLFEDFVKHLLYEREKLEDFADDLHRRLADLAFVMQVKGRGTSVDRPMVLSYLNEEQLYHAISANLLDGADNIHFAHQLLQEFFAAQKLNQEMIKGTLANTFWPSENWWQPQGWEETAILLAGLYSNDPTPVVEWLMDAQPELTAQCILRSGAARPPDETLLKLRAAWLRRAFSPLPAQRLGEGWGVRADPNPLARAAIGRALGQLTLSTGEPLDNRTGVGLNKNGVPDIDWVEIPAGAFLMGSDKEKDPDTRDGETPQRRVHLDTYRISRYPITYAQFQVFIDDHEGFYNPRWWAGLSMPEVHSQAPGDQAFKFWNHPRENVSWYDAVAFCRWLSDKLGYEIRLPTEQEWEKVARGENGLIYPYGDAFDATQANTRATGIRQTSAVGIFPDGASPFGVQDMSGNVFEWCATKWRDSYTEAEDNTLAGDARRVVRGGSWNFDRGYARAASRYSSSPDYRNSNNGFRVCRPPSLNH